jgi:hypothetical protein
MLSSLISATQVDWISPEAAAYMRPGGNSSPVAQQAAIIVIHSRLPSWRAARTSFFSHILRLKTRLERFNTPIMKPFSSISYVLHSSTSCCFILECSSSNHSLYLCFESAAWRVRSIEVVHLETRLVVFLFKKRVTHESLTGVAAIFDAKFLIISLVGGSAR